MAVFIFQVRFTARAYFSGYNSAWFSPNLPDIQNRREISDSTLMLRLAAKYEYLHIALTFKVLLDLFFVLNSEFITQCPK